MPDRQINPITSGNIIIFNDNITNNTKNTTISVIIFSNTHVTIIINTISGNINNYPTIIIIDSITTNN